MFFSYITKAKSTFKDEGAVALLLKIFNKVKTIAFQTNTVSWFVKDLREDDEELRGFTPYEVKLDDQETIFRWIEEMNSRYPWMHCEEEISTAREYGHLIPFITLDGEIVGYAKVALGAVYMRDYGGLYSLAPDKAVIYDMTIVSEFRGKRLARFLNYKVFPVLRERGVQYVYTYIEPWNTPSLKTFHSVGFKNIGVNRFVRVLCVRLHSRHPDRVLS